MSVVLSQAPIGASRWRLPLLALALLIAATFLLYRDTAVGMVGIWYRSDTFAHAFLVPPISLWLIWRRRAELAALQPRPVPWMLLPMAAIGALWLMSDLVAVNAGAQLALVAMTVLSVPAVLGWQVSRAILFPLGFLFFCVPVGEFLMPMLMEQTADFTVFALQLTGIPVYREGLRFVIPSGSWSVVEACSGVRYLIASLMVGTLFAYLNYSTMWRRWVFVGVAIVVPIIANWLRAYMIVMIGHLSDNTLAVGVDHLIYGWLFFGIVISLMFVIGSRWAEAERPVTAGTAASPATAARIGTVPMAVVSLLVLLWPLALLKVLDHQIDPAVPAVTLPETLSAGWQRSPRAPDWEPRFLDASAVAKARYAGSGPDVGVHLAYYRAQGYDRKLVSSQNIIVTSQDREWNQVGAGSRAVALAGGQQVTMRSADLLATNARPIDAPPRLTVWMVYWVDDAFTASDITAKLRGAYGRLRGHGDDAAAVIVYTYGATKADNERRLEAFVAANLEPLRERLHAARQSR